MDAEKFDGFRFAREREAQMANEDPNKDIFKRHMISTAPDHLAFGTGKHACPVSARPARASVYLASYTDTPRPGPILRGNGAQGDARTPGGQLRYQGGGGRRAPAGHRVWYADESEPEREGIVQKEAVIL